MAKWNDGIDGDHLKIAAHSGSTMRVLAGPGTGKSFALQRKVMRLLEEGVNPERILAVTFTNVAADALKKDLAALGVPGAEAVRARTLHSLCFGILQKESVLELTHRTPRPLMDFERDFLLEDLKAEFGGKRKAEALLIAYESAYARQQQDTPGVIQSQTDLEFRDRLLAWLNFHKAMLIGELIPITYDYLKQNPAASEFKLYDFILVDEYQDLNKAEQSLIDLLAKKAELVVVGDDDQSIYGFKHAHPEGITGFHITHAPLEDVNLKVCRRCPKKVVGLANELMGYFLDEKNPKKLLEYPGNEDGEIFAAQWTTLDDETKGTAKLIKQLVSDAKYGVKAEDILVLSPRRKLGYYLRDELQSKFGISSHTFFQEEALETDRAQSAYSMLAYIVDQEDRVALRVLLGLPTPLPATYQKLVAKAQEMNTSPREVLLLLVSGQLAMSGMADLVARFSTIEASRTELAGKPPSAVLDSLFDSDNPEDIEVLLSIVATITIGEETELEDIFSRLRDRVRLPEVTEDEGFVRIMSLHKSKGLTAKAVFILGCVAGLIPTIKGEDELIANSQVTELNRLRAEAKRLFFVALTRTKKYLILSSFRELDFKQAKQLNARFIGTKGSPVAKTQTSPYFGEVAKHLPSVVTGPELLAKFGVQ